MHDLAEYRLYARALSRPTFASLAKGMEVDSVFRFLKKSPISIAAKTVGDLFERAFDSLSHSYRTEYIYKTAVTNRILFGRHSPRTSSLSVELPVGRSIVDLAIFNGTSTAYEIKTELDSPRRLATQTPDYLRAFERVYIVTHPSHIDRYFQRCDERVGLLALNDNGSLTTVRVAASNKKHLDSNTLFKTLRRSEYVPALEVAHQKKISAPNGLIAAQCEQLFRELPLDQAHNIFVSSMRSRGIETKGDSFMAELPPHLRVLGYATPLTAGQKQRVLSALKEKLSR